MTGRARVAPGKLDEYVALTKYGLNTIELDVKDEGGEIAFAPTGLPLARKVGAVRELLRPAEGRARDAPQGHLPDRPGGRVPGPVPRACAPGPRDPAPRRLGLGRRTPGLAWVNPYDRRVWDYAVTVAESAARAGFDEIMLDYVRFPSDGDVATRVYPGKTSVPKGELIASFIAYAKQRLGAARRAGLDGALRALRDARHGHRAGAEVDRAARRPRPSDGLSGALRRRRARDRRRRAPSRARPCSARSSTSSARCVAAAGS